MKNKKIILISVLLSILFLLVGWFLMPFLWRHMLDVFSKIGHGRVMLQTTSMSGQFSIQTMPAIAFAMVPFILIGTTLTVKRIKKRDISTWDYFFQFCILLVVFLFGCYCKYLVLKLSIEEAAKHPMGGMVHFLPINKVKIHDWGFWACLIAGILIVLFTRKRKAA